MTEEDKEEGEIESFFG
jgi:hypothetical protein